MRVPAFLLAVAVLALGQPAIAGEQSDGAPAGQPDTAVAATPAAAAAAAVAPAGNASAEAPAETTMAAATSPPNAAAPEAAAEDDPMICRKEVETGTIGRRYKICMTKSQWEKHRQATRKFLKSVNQSRATQPGGEALGPSSGSPGG